MCIGTWPRTACPKPHAHVMLTMRAVDENGFGQKVREWNRTEMVERWRERWAELANERLAELDIDARIDHRSLEAQGIALGAAKPDRRARQTYRGSGHRGQRTRSRPRRDCTARSREAMVRRIIADPSAGLDAITQQQSTFTRRDMAKFAHRHSDGIDQFNDGHGRDAQRARSGRTRQGRSRRGSLHHAET